MLKSQLPESFRRRLAGYRAHRVCTGESGADVYRLASEGRPQLFLKRVGRGASYPLREEARRLSWLAARMPAPQVIGFEAYGGDQWLLMTSLPGTGADQAAIPARTLVRLLADALKRLHALPLDSCPFDETLDRKIARARRTVAAGLVAERNFDAANLGRTARDVLREVVASRPATEDLVVTHGDACLSNFMLQGSRFAGFIDCNRVGRADRYHDLALACRSIEGDLGSRWVGPFLRHYGLREADAERLAFYRLLDELA